MTTIISLSVASNVVGIGSGTDWGPHCQGPSQSRSATNCLLWLAPTNRCLCTNLLCDVNPFAQQRHQCEVEQQQHQRVNKVRPADKWVQSKCVRLWAVGSHHSSYPKQPACVEEEMNKNSELTFWGKRKREKPSLKRVMDCFTNAVTTWKEWTRFKFICKALALQLICKY